MGSCIPFIDEQPFAERVKSLADDELLEIWEETQQLENMLCSALHTDLALAPDYEKVGSSTRDVEISFLDSPS